MRVSVLLVFLGVVGGHPAFSVQEPEPEVAAEGMATATSEESAAEEMLQRSMQVLTGLESIHAVVRGKTVLLQGQASSPEYRAQAATMAGTILPGMFVVNQIQVGSEALQEEAVSDPASASHDESAQVRLTAIFQNVPDMADIQVTVRDGVVRLTGQALDLGTAESAEALASKMPGVVYVDNNVQVSREVERRLAPVIDNTLKKLWGLWLALPLVLIALIIVGFFWFLGRLAMRWERIYKLVGRQPLVKGIIQQIVFLLFLLVGVILALDLLDARRLVTTLFGAAGLVGLALGFALKDIAENYLASLLLALRRPFTADDYVQIDQYEGQVIRLNMRDSVLMTAEGNHLRLPNALVFKSVIVNYTRNPMRRFGFEIGVGVNEDLSHVLEFGLESLKKVKGVAEEPSPTVLVKNLGDSSVILSFFAWVNQMQFGLLKVKSSAIRQVKEALDEAGIEMPSPTYQLDVFNRQAGVPGAEKLDQRAELDHEAEADLRPDHDLDRQIEEERKVSDETNLL